MFATIAALLVSCTGLVVFVSFVFQIELAEYGRNPVGHSDAFAGAPTGADVGAVVGDAVCDGVGAGVGVLLGAGDGAPRWIFNVPGEMLTDGSGTVAPMLTADVDVDPL
ncbi:hypothetical protein WPS_15720 [Vulcanimicrobium alpinum]|uniref:Uncharacterized protein n=1 Tax=Vulcanimicrobium alpinum TaxID=3016050 RepID=A0AAN2C9R1_UNVUL|nr:hypothetical protein WPS_15720 [Vulcanimicrobium alpinum]